MAFDATPAFSGVKTGAAGGATSDAITSTAVNLIVVRVAWYALTTPNGVMSDSKGNTWLALNRYEGAANCAVRLFYCLNPIVGAGHTFSYLGTDTYASLAYQGWVSSDNPSLDAPAFNGVGLGSSGTISTGSITPAATDELLIAALGHSSNSGGAIGIDNGFTITGSTAFVGGLSQGGSMAYRVYASTAAINPQWNSATGMSDSAASIAAFKFNGGSGGGGGGSTLLAKLNHFMRA